MKYFLKMIEEAKKGIRHGENILDKEGRLFWESVVFNEVFVFSPKEDFTKDVNDVREEDIEKLDAPFKVFSFELAGDRVLTSSSLDEKVETSTDVQTLCIMCVETGPKSYHFFMLVKGISLSSGGVRYAVLSSRPGDARYKWSEKITDIYLERLSREVSGVESVRAKIKIGTGKNKRFHKINKVIHVVPKKERDKIIRECQTYIDWSHRWSVRGHWREIAGIGKDREGNYCVNGMTWVKEHEKGPEDLPLIKKQRVVDA